MRDEYYDRMEDGKADAADAEFQRLRKECREALIDSCIAFCERHDIPDPDTSKVSFGERDIKDIIENYADWNVEDAADELIVTRFESLLSRNTEETHV